MKEVIRCYKQIKERSVIVEKCWEKQCLENKDHVILCTNCGQVDGYEPMKEFCSFHNNQCEIIGRSTYFRKYWYCGMLHTSLRCNLLYNFKTYFGPKLSKYSIISLDIHDNPMWTTTYTISNIHNIILSYAYHSSDLWKTHPVNYFIT